MLDFPDIKEAPVGNTRKEKSIDWIFSNMDRFISEAGTISPLETEKGQPSDHRVAYCKIALKRKENFVWQNYTYRHYNEDSVKAFKDCIIMHDWREVFNAEGSIKMTEAYQDTIMWAMGTFFPLKSRRKKSKDLPMMTKKLQKMIQTRKRIFWSEGRERTEVWKAEKKKVDQAIKDRKQGYI